jgi:NTE family protein
VLSRPDTLVLGGGGVLGEAWMLGVLAGLEDAAGVDLRRCEYFLGTSAGSIVAARLAAGERPEHPPRTAPAPRPPSARPPGADGGIQRLIRGAGAWAVALGSPLAGVTLSAVAPAGALVRAAALRALPEPTGSLAGLRREVDARAAAFDGRLRVVAVARASGRRVVFGAPGAPRASVGEAVQASCAVPWMFEPVAIGGVEYVDGGVWSPTNLDVAPAGRGSEVLCLNPTAGLEGPHPLLALAREASWAAMSIEAQSLRARGARVRLLGPDRDCVAAIGADLMDRGRRPAVLAAGYAQGLALPVR